MKTLTQHEMEQVSGGNPLGVIAAGLAIANALYNFGHGIYDGVRK